jgi:hypothetical protein
MWKYLLGFAGPAQCVELVANQPMKIHMVPRASGPAQARARKPAAARASPAQPRWQGPLRGLSTPRAAHAPAAARCT